ncbi:flagellar FliJ family protein [Rhodocaloribacter litoris]|uniref:flagellar FliJ family protein n=1 Tax=Rhodocaloribacter litoris TaxID=2558931 RepID=UPI00141EADB0|nr:flagellar FliJ family protein [Rhodocaloribacter litoris]QXD16044.1 flagellar FliJ family protein [Rhodocaloribacter litoris]GIV59772.1 MAG: hypothetical protein KatS3mg043_0861 [Rhodothermaceae bacterium]
MAGKKFQFSLQSVLKLRRHESDTARQALARTMEARKTQEERLAEIEARLHEAAERELQARRTAPQDFRRLAAYRLELQQARDRERRSLEQKRLEEERARHRLLARRRAEETLQTLHDEQKMQHEQALQRAETDLLDEQALMTHLRTHSSAGS